MGFDKFGVISHTPETNVADFVNYLGQGKVMATKCKKCGAVYFPPRVDCANCFSSDPEWFEVKGEGKLLTFSMVNYGPMGFEDTAPYTLGVADFGPGLKIFSYLNKEVPQSEIKVGLKLKVAPVKLADDRVTYEFRKA